MAAAGPSLFVPLTESLSIELKGWLDLKDKSDLATFCKACIALHNYGGGTLRIGFDDKTGQPLPYTLSNSVAKAFHPDDLQKILNNHTSEQIALFVEHIDIGGTHYPKIEIKGGVTRPVFATKDIVNNAGDKRLSMNKIYVRIVQAGQFSSSEPQTVRDWEGLFSRCMNNREVDLAGFVRRHFTPEEMKKLRSALFPMEPPPEGGGSAKFPEEPSPKGGGGIKSEKPGSIDDDVKEFGDPVNKILTDGNKRYEPAMLRAGIALDTRPYWEVAAMISGPLLRNPATTKYYRALMAVIPALTGLPTWMDTRHTVGSRGGAAHFHNAWEQIFSGAPEEITQFGVIYEEPAFYLRRTYFEDLGNLSLVHKSSVLALELQIRNVAEVIYTLLSFAQVTKGNAVPFSIALKFRWRDLRGRKLITYNSRGVSRILTAASQQSEVLVGRAIPWDLAADAVYKYVHDICRELFKVFDGADLPLETSQFVTNEILRLG